MVTLPSEQSAEQEATSGKVAKFSSVICPQAGQSNNKINKQCFMLVLVLLSYCQSQVVFAINIDVRWEWIAALCLLYGVILAAWQPSGAEALGRDFRDFYKPVALQIVHGEGFRSPDGLADRYPPGYPLLLAPVLALAEKTGASERLLLLGMDLLLLGAGAALLYLIALRLGVGQWAALPAALWLTYPPVVFSLGKGLTELPFAVALFGMTLALLDGRFAAAGLLCGAAMLIRPAGLALLMGGAIWLLLARPRLRAGVFAATALLAVLPWEVFVYARTGEWILLSTGGRTSVFDGLTWSARQRTYRVAGESNPRLLLTQQRVVDASPQLAGVGDLMSFMGAEFRRDPGGVANLYLTKAARAFYGTDSRRHERYLLLMQIPYLALSLTGFFLLFRHGQLHTALLFVILVACSWVLTVAALSILRYMVPAMGLLFVAASGIGYWKRLYG